MAFGYGHEDLRMVLEPMASTAAEVVWSMGDDAPLAVLSPNAPPLYAFFRQRFAQVTNPPMDSLRESMVMSLRMHLGRRGSPLVEKSSYARMLRVEHPVLLPDEMTALRAFPQFPSATLDATYCVFRSIRPGNPIQCGLRFRINSARGVRAVRWRRCGSWGVRSGTGQWRRCRACAASRR